MFAVLRFFGFLPGFLQDFERAGFHIQADGIGPIPRWRQTVTDKIIFIFDQSIDHIIDQLRINHRTIRRNADNHISLRLFRGLIVTVQHIVETAACEGDSAEVAVFGDGVVGGIGRRGENGLGNEKQPARSA